MARKKGGRKKSSSRKRSSKKKSSSSHKGKYVTHAEFSAYKKHVDHRFDKHEGYIIRIVDAIRKTNKQRAISTMKDSPAQAVPNKIKMN